MAERIREKVADHVRSVHKVQFKLTTSIGIAAATASMSGIDALLCSADQALYQAKSRGRNVTVQWSPPVVSRIAAE